MDDYWGHGMNNGYDIWGFFFMVLMMVLVVLGIILLVRYLNQNSSNSGKGDTALDVLKTRYAKGEIDKKEYQEKLKDLAD